MPKLVGVPGHHTLAAQASEEGILDRVWVSIGGAEPEEDTKPVLRIIAGLPEILVEGVAHRPAALRVVGGLSGNEQVRESRAEDGLQDRPGIGQAWKPGLQQQRCEVRRILIQRKSQ